MSKKDDFLRKMGVITFLILLVLGFTVPGIVSIFQEDTTKTTPLAEPRLCQTDAECFLTCDGKPINVLCLNNICQQNECNTFSLFSFKEEPLHFSLKVSVDATPIILENRTQSSNFFVQFAKDEVNVFTRGLYLLNILEKVRIGLDGNCLYMDDFSYCSSTVKKVKVNINGNVTSSYLDYIPKEGDMIEIVYN